MSEFGIIRRYPAAGLRYFLLLVLAPFGPADAAWEVLPEAIMEVETNDNSRMRAEDEEISTTRTVLDAEVTLSTFSERGNVLVQPRVRTDAYTKSINQELESTDVFLHGRGAYSWERFAIDLRADYADESVLSSELSDAVPEDPDLEDPLDPSTGDLNELEQDRERLDMRANLDFILSERNSLVVEARAINVAYEPQGQTTRNDFDNKTLYIGVNRRVDDRNEITARLLVNDFEVPSNQNKTNTVGVEGTFTRPLAPNWRMNLTANVARSDYSFLDEIELPTGEPDFVLVDNAEATFAARIAFRRRTDRSTWNIDIGRRVLPNSNGFLTIRDELRGYIRQQVRPRVALSLAGRIYQSEKLDNIDSNNDRDYARVDLDVEWTFSDRWYLIGGYSLRQQEFTNLAQGGDATANTFRIGVNYRTPSRSGI